MHRVLRQEELLKSVTKTSSCSDKISINKADDGESPSVLVPRLRIPFQLCVAHQRWASSCCSLSTATCTLGNTLKMQRTGAEYQQPEKSSVVLVSVAKASLESMELSFLQIPCHYKPALKYQRLFLRLHFLSGITTWGQHHTRNGTHRAPMPGILHSMEYCACFKESHLPEKSWQMRSRSKNSNKSD